MTGNSPSAKRITLGATFTPAAEGKQDGPADEVEPLQARRNHTPEDGDVEAPQAKPQHVRADRNYDPIRAFRANMSGYAASKEQRRTRAAAQGKRACRPGRKLQSEPGALRRDQARNPVVSVTQNLDDAPGIDVDFYDVQKLFGLFERLEHSPLLDLLPFRTPFSQTVPLDGNKYFPATRVTGPLDFVPGATAAGGANGYCRLKLTADGVHTPTFGGGFTEARDAAGDTWVNTTGVVNVVHFCGNRAGAYTYTIWQL